MYLYDEREKEEELEKLKLSPPSMEKIEKMELDDDDEGEDVVSVSEGYNKSGGRVWNESKKLWEIAAPAILTAVAQFSFEFVTAAFIGHVGELELAAVSVVQNVIEGFVYGIMVTIFNFLIFYFFKTRNISLYISGYFLKELLGCLLARDGKCA